MQRVLILMMKYLNVSSSTVMPHRDFSFSRTESCRTHIPKKHITINNPSWINNDVKQSIARLQRAYDARKRNSADETRAEYFTDRRLVKGAVKQADKTRKAILQYYAY